MHKRTLIQEKNSAAHFSDRHTRTRCVLHYNSLIPIDEQEGKAVDDHYTVSGQCFTVFRYTSYLRHTKPIVSLLHGFSGILHRLVRIPFGPVRTQPYRARKTANSTNDNRAHKKYSTQADETCYIAVAIIRPLSLSPLSPQHLELQHCMTCRFYPQCTVPVPVPGRRSG